MANAAGFIRESIWHDADWRRLSRGAQALYMQLLSQRELDCAGVLPLNPHKWAKGCAELTVEAVLADLAELHAERFVVADDDTDEVLVRTYIRNSNVLKIPNMRKAAGRAARLVTSPAIKAALAEELRASDDDALALVADEICPRTRAAKGSRRVPEPFPNPSVTVPEPFPNGSRRVPEGSGVGVGEGVTHLGSNSGGEQTPPRCSKHPKGNPNDDACRGCMRVRVYEEQHAAAQADNELEAKRRARERAEGCPICRGTNWLPDTEPAIRCNHEGATTA